jgi:hypothetical protein
LIERIYLKVAFNKMICKPLALNLTVSPKPLRFIALTRPTAFLTGLVDVITSLVMPVNVMTGASGITLCGISKTVDLLSGWVVAESL